MKLTIPRKELLTALAAVKPVATNGTPTSRGSAILSHLLIVAREKSVSFTASNLELHVRISTDATIGKEGEATCRASLLADIIRMADGADVSLTLQNRNLHVECGSAKHEIATLEPEEFPPFPTIAPSGQDFTLEDAAFRTMLAETAFACSTDEKRYVLNGVLVKLAAGQLHVAGCSGFMLAVSSATLPEGPENFTCIVPSGTAKELLRLLSDDAEKPHRLTVTAGAGQIQFAFGDITIVSKLIEGEYPGYARIIPAEDVTANLSRVELVRSIGRMALVADQVQLAFTRNSLAITSVGKRGNEFIGQASDSLLIPSNHTVQATFSTKYILDILNAIPDAAIELHIKPTGASLFKPPGRDWSAVLRPVDPPEAKKAKTKKVKPSLTEVPPADNVEKTETTTGEAVAAEAVPAIA